MGTHTGTHVDAFSHMHQGAKTLSEIPLERFFGTSQVVDINGVWPVRTGLFFIEEVGKEDFEKIQKLNPIFVGGNITEELERALLGIEIITYTNLINLESV